MAVTAITPIALALNTASVDHADADATAVATGTDGFSVADSAAMSRNRGIVIKMVSVTNAASFVFAVGTKPPSMQTQQGTLTVSLSANDVKYLVIEQSRFRDSSGAITGTVTGAGANTSLMSVFTLPIGS